MVQHSEENDWSMTAQRKQVIPKGHFHFKHINTSLSLSTSQSLFRSLVVHPSSLPILICYPLHTILQYLCVQQSTCYGFCNVNYLLYTEYILLHSLFE